MDRLAQDVRYGARMLARNPGFTAVAIATLALGIGLNSAIFTLVNSIVLRPLPVAEPDRLVLLQEANPERGFEGNVSWPNFADWREQTDVFVEMAVITRTSRNMSGTDLPVRLATGLVSPGFFRLFGLEPILGRAFGRDEQLPGREAVVVLTEPLWRSRFGAETSILGSTVTLDDGPYTVVGVVPRPPTEPDIEIFTPLPLNETVLARRNHFLRAYGRLRTGLTIEEASADLNLVARRLQQTYADTNAGWLVILQPLKDLFVAEVRDPLYTLLGIVGAVLLIACANVANLLLARASARDQEIAVRAALGAGRGRLVRQLITESMLLAILGGAGGLLLARWGVGALAVTLPAELPRTDEIGVDVTVLAFTLGVSLFTGLLFGSIPAVRASRPSPKAPLGTTGARSAAGRLSPRHLLVVAEVALAIVLLVAAGLFLRSLAEQRRVDIGLEPENLLTMRLSLSNARYGDDVTNSEFVTRLVDSVEAIAGVASAAVGASPPIAGPSTYRGVIRTGAPQPAPEDLEVTDYTHYHWVSRGYFETMGIPLGRGRGFSAADTLGSEPVAVLNDVLARELFGDEDPVGQRVRVFTDETTPRRVIGVVGSVLRRIWQGEPDRQIYVPLLQDPRMATALFVRTDADPGTMVGAIRDQVLRLDADQPVYDIRTMTDILADALGPQRALTSMLGAFAALALALTLVGLYGVVSYTVTLRRGEIGVRLALGARRAAIVGTVVRQGLALASIGAGIGVAVAVGLGRFVAAELYGVTPTDPAVLGAVTLTVIAAAAAASFAPARRATRVDPVASLRAE